MRLCEQFTIDEEPADLWRFLEQAELVAACMPGIEAVEVLDPDNVRVRITQSIGPMSATFDARVKVLERVDGEAIHFEAIGKSVRGAVGSVRARNSVTLAPVDLGTLVTVEGEVALAGALGSVGQKIVAKQANKVTSAFATNLRSALAQPEAATAATAASAASAVSAAGGQSAVPAARAGERAWAPPSLAAAAGSDAERSRDLWLRASFAMSAVSAALSLVVLIRTRGGRR